MTDGLENELREIMETLAGSNTAHLDNQALSDRLRENKTAYAAALAARLRDDPNLARRAPEAFRIAIKQLRGLS